MTVLNELDRFHLAGDVVDRVPRLRPINAHFKQYLRNQLVEHKQYISRTRRRPSGNQRLEVALLTAIDEILVLNSGSSSSKEFSLRNRRRTSGHPPEPIWQATAEWNGDQAEMQSRLHTAQRSKNKATLRRAKKPSNQCSIPCGPERPACLRSLRNELSQAIVLSMADQISATHTCYSQGSRSISPHVRVRTAA